MRLSVLCSSVVLFAACNTDDKAGASGSDDPVDSGGSGEDGGDGGDAGVPTWHQDVAPLVAAHCAGCHTDGGLAFDLTDPASAAALSGAIRTAVEAGTMPPWGQDEDESCEQRLPFKDDVRLSDADKATLMAWIDGGTPEGDPATAAALTTPSVATLDDATQTLPHPAAYTTAGTRDEFICFVLDPELDNTRWLTGLEFVPGNAAVVHHALIYTDPSGRGAAQANEEGWYPCFGSPGFDETTLVGAWAPGIPPTLSPENAGTELDAGTNLVVQVHYHPRGDAAEPDLSALRLRWTDDEPALRNKLLLLGNQSSRGEGLLPGPNDPEDRATFLIPADVADHTETMESESSWWVGHRFQVYLVATHMHYIGVDMEIELIRASPEGDEPDEECLIGTPNYSFEWQRLYSYDAPVADLPQVDRADTFRLNCTYDNTPGNPGTVAAMADAGLDAPMDVRLGDGTLDEMCIAVIGAVY